MQQLEKVTPLLLPSAPVFLVGLLWKVSVNIFVVTDLAFIPVHSIQDSWRTQPVQNSHATALRAAELFLTLMVGLAAWIGIDSEGLSNLQGVGSCESCPYASTVVSVSASESQQCQCNAGKGKNSSLLSLIILETRNRVSWIRPQNNLN